VAVEMGNEEEDDLPEIEIDEGGTGGFSFGGE
jgi:hypothetical protein